MRNFYKRIRTGVAVTAAAVIMATSAAYAGEYKPLLTEGKVWVYEQLVQDISDNFINLKYSDTVGEEVSHEGMKGRSIHRKMLTENIPETLRSRCEDCDYELYEKDGTIYLKGTLLPCFATGHITPIMAFGLNVGDPMPVQTGAKGHFVSQKDEVETLDCSYARWIIKCDEPSPDSTPSDVIVEGIGSMRGGLPYLDIPDIDDGTLTGDARLMEVYDNGRLIFEYKDFMQGLGSANTVREDRVWVYYGYNWENMNYYFMEFGPEVTVNGKAYRSFRHTRTLEVEYDSGSYVKDTKMDESLYYLREENGRIFELVYEDTGREFRISDLDKLKPGAKPMEIEIYDWNLPDGADWATPPFYVYYSDEMWNKEFWIQEGLIDTKIKTCAPVTVDNAECRVFELEKAPDYLGNLEFIEGIGPLKSGTIGWMTMERTTGWADFYTPLDQVWLHGVYSKDGTLLYGKELPSSVDGIYDDAANGGGGAAYDLMGREIRDPQPGTVYIRDGRKHVAR